MIVLVNKTAFSVLMLNISVQENNASSQTRDGIFIVLFAS